MHAVSLIIYKPHKKLERRIFFVHISDNKKPTGRLYQTNNRLVFFILWFIELSRVFNPVSQNILRSNESKIDVH